MRTPRKLRPFRPSTFALESICPVSGFAAALPLSTSAVTAQAGTTATPSRQPIRAELTGTSSGPARINAPRLATNPSGAVPSTQPTVASPTTITLTAASETGLASGVDVGRYVNTISITGANIPMPRLSSVPTPGQDTGGSGGITPTQATTPPAVGVVATPASPSGSSSQALVAPVSPADLSSKIRPMTLAAISSSSSPAAGSGTANAMVGSTSSNAISPVSSGSGSTSGSTSGSSSVSQSGAPDVKLYISGSGGQHPGETAPPPVFVQGSLVSPSLALQGTDANNYTIADYKWTYPLMAIKGYGAFATAQERPDNPGDPGTYTVFTGNPGNTAAVDTGFTADDLAYDPTEANDHVFNYFYFGPSAAASQDVTVSAVATAVNKIDGTRLSLSNSETLTLVRPSPSIFITQFGQAGLNPAGTELQFDKNAPAGGARGIVYNVSVNDGNFGGSFLIAQTMLYSNKRSYSGPNTFGTTQIDGQVDNGNGGFKDPGVISDAFGYGAGEISTGVTQSFEDTPGTVLETPDYYKTFYPGADTPIDHSIKDDFFTTLMYHAPGGIYVPLQEFDWGWSASADYVNFRNQWNQTAANQYGPSGPFDTTDFPVWQYTFGQVSGHWRNQS